MTHTCMAAYRPEPLIPSGFWRVVNPSLAYLFQLSVLWSLSWKTIVYIIRYFRSKYAGFGYGSR